jgi:hypothetical protein
MMANLERAQGYRAMSLELVHKAHAAMSPEVRGELLELAGRYEKLAGVIERSARLRPQPSAGAGWSVGAGHCARADQSRAI